MNRKIMMSGFSIVAALTLMSGAAFAAFTSSASNDGNTFGAGSLLLSINTQSPTSTGVFSVTNFAPGDSSTQTLNLKNEGSVNATNIILTGVDINTGILAPVLNMELYLDNDSSGTVTGGDTLLGGPAALNNGGWTNLSLGQPLAAGDTKKILVRITFDPSANDSYQGGTINFDLNFQATQ